MARTCPVPAPWGERGWKFKIRDKERVEPPHLSVLHRSRTWRYGLRERVFLDETPSPRDVPRALLDELERRHGDFVMAWDSMYPNNPVHSSWSDDV